MSLNAMAMPAALEPGPLVTLVRSRTVAKVDSIGLVAQVDPVLGGEVVQREEHVEVVGDLGHRLGPLRSVEVLERLDRLQCVVAVRGVIDFGERTLRAGLGVDQSGAKR
jgi:hypothetical protein